MGQLTTRFVLPTRFLCKISIALCISLLLFSITLQAFAEDNSNIKLKTPVRKTNAKAKMNSQWTPNVLLVMPDSEEPKDDVMEVLREVKGTVTKTIGEGPLTVWVVQFENTAGFVEAEKKLMQDKHFTSVQRDYLFESKAVSVNDPYFASQWHMNALNVVPAWNISQGGQNTIAIIDSGCNPSIRELMGKTYAGYDAVNKVERQADVQGHGTMVATTAAANTNNGTGTAAPARLARVYPVRAGYSNGSVSSAAILEGIYKCGNSGIKIINISANGNPPYSFANKSVNGALHQYFKWFHDTKGGLIFNSAGNSGTKDNNPLVPYLIVVSAIDTSYYLASFSTYGNPVWFTGPGTNIYCTSRTSQIASVSGTSFSSPLVASIATLIWGANPNLRNTDVETILKKTCYKSGSSSWTQWYGYGMPNAEKAMKAAKGLPY